MLLTIDVGNTNTVLGVFEGEEVIEHWRIATDPVRTADELAVVLQGLLGQSARIKAADIGGIALCSTVPSVLHEMREMVRRYYGDVPSLIVEPGVRTGSVPIRQCSATSSPSNTPSTVLVLPTSIVSSMAFPYPRAFRPQACGRALPAT